MGIVVIGAVFVDVKGYPEANFIPTGRNAGRVEHVHGGVGRNVAEDIEETLAEEFYGDGYIATSQIGDFALLKRLKQAVHDLANGKTASHEPVLLFSIYVGGDEGEQMGAVMGEDGIPVPVNLLLTELDLTGWSAEDADLMYTMQEASNQLVDMLPLLD